MRLSIEAVSALAMLCTLPPSSRRAGCWPETPIADRYGLSAVRELLGASLIRRSWAFEAAGILKCLPRRGAADQHILIVTDQGWEIHLPAVPLDA